MFVCGGIYRVVKETTGGTRAKFSVSALRFDHLLSGPISGVSAGQYWARLPNELLAYGHSHMALGSNSAAQISRPGRLCTSGGKILKASPNPPRKHFGSCSSRRSCSRADRLVRGAHFPPAPLAKNIALSVCTFFARRIPLLKCPDAFDWHSGNQLWYES
jgi:hypothetical protein